MINPNFENQAKFSSDDIEWKRHPTKPSYENPCICSKRCEMIADFDANGFRGWINS